MATGNTSFDKIISTTLQDHGKEIFDAISTNNAFYYMLKKRGNIKLSSGGRRFTHPLQYALNSSFKSYGRLDTIDTPITDNITRVEYLIKVIAGSIVLSLLDEAMNAGDRQKLLDLVDQTKDEAETSMSEVMGDQVWKNGSANNDFDGLQYHISDSPSTDTDWGGINPSTSGNDYARNQVDTATVTAFNTSQEGIKAMNALRLNATFGRRGPTAVFTTKTVYNLYELGMTSNIRYLKTELADSAFLHLAYMTMPVLFDDNCLARHLYMVDMDTLWLQLLARGNFQVTDFQPSHDQLTRTALMYVFGNITCGSRRTQGVITSISG